MTFTLDDGTGVLEAYLMDSVSNRVGIGIYNKKKFFLNSNVCIHTYFITERI